MVGSPFSVAATVPFDLSCSPPMISLADQRNLTQRAVAIRALGWRLRVPVRKAGRPVQIVQSSARPKLRDSRRYRRPSRAIHLQLC
jgi:hypothetical protein